LAQRWVRMHCQRDMDEDFFSLTDPVDAISRLVFDRWVPPP
jgi:hypothetical protein